MKVSKGSKIRNRYNQVPHLTQDTKLTVGSPLAKLSGSAYVKPKIVSEYDQEIPQSQTTDNPVAPQGRAAQPSRDTSKQIKQSNQLSSCFIKHKPYIFVIFQGGGPDPLCPLWIRPCFKNVKNHEKTQHTTDRRCSCLIHNNAYAHKCKFVQHFL